MSEALLQVESVTKTFRAGGWPRRGAPTVAVDRVGFTMAAGESLGVVGESGSGKSTLAGVICGLVRPDSGRVRIAGRDIAGRDVHAGRRVDPGMWRTVQMVFQDPYTSLNPYMTIEEIVAEPLRLWRRLPRAEARKRAAEILDRVGLGSRVAARRPAGLSGGQRQRASIARALAVSPELMVLDESVSALDVSVQAQILQLLLDLKREENLAYLLISHDISVIRLVCDRVLVMNKGAVVEECTADGLTEDAVQHPYTRRLLAAVPVLSVG
ncbi:ABC transporter ATP-binding protein [Actinomadura chibensis]|uniref:ABC transporter ATP-binding protein n=1 Tax=Actinomadura chibensis TaxID=392828 RepID=A0A5D0NIC3_9ACTN|nr:ATP-binding cassette domain-containing protein [Actinomadura chibensis]TYB44108.1 ABC transporter ATP-binding protein [Actinomadura chibensis]